METNLNALNVLTKPDSPLYELSLLFSDAGFSFNVVGGTIRDLILGVESDDFDICTNALPDQILEIVKPVADHLWRQGEVFGTIGLQYKDLKIEITTYRHEIYVDDSRKPQVEFGDNLEVDLSRRDFTINAMAFSLPEAKLVDPYNGLDDLMNKRLRTMSMDFLLIKKPKESSPLSQSL